MPTGARDLPPASAACHLFFGLFPPAPVRDAMAGQVARLRAAAPVRGRWTDPRRYHLTVQFLGRFDEAAPAPMPAIFAAAERAADGTGVRAFELQLDTTGAFARSRVGWLGCSQVPEELTALWRALGQALDAHGVPRDAAPSYAPHVTVLRDVREPWPGRSFPPITWRVPELVLARSRLGSGQPYEPLRAWPLA
ncbi:RNA 2',3'-cyclic phosphodiesterase [Agrilutibacter solisilvae]|uniref:RNA 2',3'-cyclic phosphodiesterase n=1 Tax=Agrilutibacter solisilvae TaxID=2763317 RepID=A0A974Y0F6_9GAMM|nr:RNA 2',3'-cyclic phosphodiesterase [Lysobacter solisilvae]QSX78150.1 RNA 2',3'-cyclic phosphodiesterase [Lysobacter solisilvae]